MNPVLRLQEYARIFREAPRQGANRDKPEGSRTIELSETLALQIAKDLESIADLVSQVLAGTER